MRRLIMLLAAAVVVLVACSPSEPLAFDLTHPMEPPEAPFEISGAAADEGMLCSLGRFVEVRMEDMDGEPLTDEGWAQLFDNAVETGSVAEAKGTKVFECDDDSGSITINDHAYLDFALLDVESFGTGETIWGTWTIEGTGDYGSLTGSGNIVVAWEESQFHYTGEVKT